MEDEIEIEEAESADPNHVRENDDFQRGKEDNWGFES